MFQPLLENIDGLLILAPLAQASAFDLKTVRQLLAGHRVLRLKFQNTLPDFAGLARPIAVAVTFGQHGQGRNVVGVFFQNAIQFIFGGLPTSFGLVGFNQFQPHVNVIGCPFDRIFVGFDGLFVFAGPAVIFGHVLPDAGHLLVGEGIGVVIFARAAAEQGAPIFGRIPEPLHFLVSQGQIVNQFAAVVAVFFCLFPIDNSLLPLFVLGSGVT